MSDQSIDGEESARDNGRDGTATPERGFEAALDELESIVKKMESGDLSLEDSLAAYERGVALTRECQTALASAEQRLQILSERDGRIVSEAFGDTDGEAGVNKDSERNPVPGETDRAEGTSR